MNTLWHDLRYAARLLVRNPAFTLVAVATLALGIGANTTIFSVVNGVLLHPLPYQDPDRLVLLWQRSHQLPAMMVAYPDYLDWRQQNTIFDDIALYNRFRNLNLTGRGEPERVPAAFVTRNLFDLLGVRPLQGRTFLPEEDQPDGRRAVLLSHGSWQRRFGGNAAAVGQALTLDAQSYTVVGIMPPGFLFPSGVEIWVPLGLLVDEEMMQRGNHPGLIGLARLKPGVSVEQADSEMETIAARLEQQYPDSNIDIRVTVTQLREAAVGGIRLTLLVLLAAVGFVLLIACVNVANLLLARATVRQKEFAIRAALGAARGRLLRQLVTESLVLSALGGGLGLLLAVWGTDWLRAANPGNIPRASEIGVDASVLFFTLAVSLFTALIFGAAPLLEASRGNLAESLKEGGRGTGAGSSRHRLRAVLVVAEVASSLVLLICAGLMIRSFVRLVRVNPGFDPKNVLTLRIDLPPLKYPQGEQVAGFYRQVVERVDALPGVEAAAIVNVLPFSNQGWQTSIAIEGRPEPAPGETPLVDAAIISPDYFRALAIPLQRGRPFAERDTAQAPGVVIVNQTLARRFWPDEDPIGKRLKRGGFDSTSPWLEVVGVVGDVKRTALEGSVREEFYLPHLQNPDPNMTVVARTTTEPMSLVPAIRQQVLAMDADQPLYAPQTMEQFLALSLAPRRFSMLLLGLFALLAVVLAAVGLYGVMAYLVAQRTHEIGVRLALGAQRRDILRLVLRQGMVLTLTGVAMGLAGAWAVSRLLASLLFEVRPTDPLTFAGVSVLLAGVALLACYLPARRASRVEPLVALRYE